MSSTQRSRSRSLRVTARDEVLLSFAAEHRFVTAPQAAVLLATTSAATERRLRTLAGAGLLRGDQGLDGWPAPYRVTRAGLQVAGSDLEPPRPIALQTYRHDDALVWLMLYALEGRFGPVRAVTGERRMRSEDGRANRGLARHGVRLGGVGARGRERLHYPDMVAVVAGGQQVAFELERTTKGRPRLDTILAAYAADRRIDAVVYLVDRASTGRAIRRAAARLGIERLVSVRTLTPAAGPDRVRRGRVASRAQERSR